MDAAELLVYLETMAYGRPLHKIRIVVWDPMPGGLVRPVESPDDVALMSDGRGGWFLAIRPGPPE